MKRLLNIAGPTYKYKYLIEYNKSNVVTDGHDIQWCIDNDCVRLFTGDVLHYRNCNDWYNIKDLNSTFYQNYVPNDTYITTINFYIPNFAAHVHATGIKYMITLNTWINGVKVDLGSYMFKPTDAEAIPSGSIKAGNHEYTEYVSFDIIDPYYLMYSDAWDAFRKNICKEPKNLNSTPASLYASVYAVTEYENHYIMKAEYIGSSTNFVVSGSNDYLKTFLSVIHNDDSPGFRFNVQMNPEYNDLTDYLYETYNIKVHGSTEDATPDIRYNIILKKKDSAVPGPTVFHTLGAQNYGQSIQDIKWNSKGMDSFKLFFSSWNDYEEGWYLVGSLIVYDTILSDSSEVLEEIEMLTVFSNIVPVTQEIYSMFVGEGSKKIDMSNLYVPDYKIINKLDHIMYTIDRPVSSINNTLSMPNLPASIKHPDKLTIHNIELLPLIKNY